MTKNKGLWIFLAGLGVTLVAGITVIILVYAPQPADAKVSLRAVTAFGLDDGFNPVDITTVYGPDDGFFLSVSIENLAEPRIVSARWRYLETVITTQDQVVDAAGGAYTVGFELVRKDEPWPVGDYSVDLLVAGDLVGTVQFSVALP